MTRKRRLSVQEHLYSREKGDFVGRLMHISEYQENFRTPTSDERHRFLFNVYGDAGVGKTSLTERLRQIAVDNGCLTAYIDQPADDVISALTAIAGEIRRNGAKLSEFEKRAATYWEHRHKMESDPSAPEGVAALLTKGLVGITLSISSSAPYAGRALARVDHAAVADQVNQARMYVVRKLKNHADILLLLSPDSELTSAFVTGLNRIGRDRSIALFFDSYERNDLFLDRWLFALYSGQYGDLPDSLVTTISGQNQLDQNLWHRHRPLISDIPLKPFSEAEARHFLAAKGIADERIVEVILKLSGCLPMWLATLADARPSDPTEIGDPAGDAVERFLQWENEHERRSMALAGALPRMLNQDVLEIITPPGRARAMFGWLCRLPFVSPRAGSWAYHEVVRAAMLRLQRAQAPSQWRSDHVALAEANERWAQDVAGWPGEAWANARWIDYTREAMYHLLCADPVNNLGRVLDSAEKAAEHSAARARQWAELLADAGDDTDEPELTLWAQRLSENIQSSELVLFYPDGIDDTSLDEEASDAAQPPIEYPETRIVAWGPPSSGKTTFLAAIGIALNRKPGGWSVAGANDASEMALIMGTAGLSSEKTFPSGTQTIDYYDWVLNGWIPSARRGLFRTEQHRVPVRIGLQLVDVAGEIAHYDKVGSAIRQELIENFRRSRGIIYIFDPAREYDHGDIFDFTFGPLVQLARQATDAPGLPGVRLPHYVAVCITKFDDIRVFETAKALNLIAVDPADSYRLPRVNSNDARKLLRNLCAQSGSGNAEMALNALEQYFLPGRIKYFVTSSVGFYIDPGSGRFNPDDYQNYIPGDHENQARIRGPVHPINVAEPLLWLSDKIIHSDESTG